MPTIDTHDDEDARTHARIKAKACIDRSCTLGSGGIQMAKNAPAMDRSIERSIAMAAGRPAGDHPGTS
jgi:hypothetical protein